MFRKLNKNLLISEIIFTIVSNYQTPDCLPGCDLEYVKRFDALQTGWCALESVDTEIKDLDN